MNRASFATFAILLATIGAATVAASADDHLFDLQTQAVRDGKSAVGHWGPQPDDYMAWGSHSNRLIPVYTFGTRGGANGVDLTSYTGANSPYRSEAALRRIYGRVPTNTVNPQAEYLDQTNLADLQRAAVAAGKKHVFLVVFDGMDWQTTRNAAIYASRSVSYSEGRGRGLHFLDYEAAGTSQFGWMVTSPHNDGTNIDVDRQEVKNPGGQQPGGYNVLKGGPNPWTPGKDAWYPIGKSETGKGPGEHAYPDSAGTAVAMTSGVKTYNGAINVDATGAQVSTIAHELQRQGWSVGVVTSVPISHATPAAAYAHNVIRNDYQDLTRDLLGLPSVAHPQQPLPGLDVVLGTGYGALKDKDSGQGKNYVPGNRYLTDADLRASDVEHGGRYTVVTRTEGTQGGEHLKAAARKAAEQGTRLLGFFGVGATGHLPFRTADGDFRPPIGRRKTAEEYTSADVEENPTLAEMTEAALEVVSRNKTGFWLLVEAGDVDWANHDNNLDNSVGAVLSGDAAVRVLTDWVERHSNWDESLVIVTADHGHYLILDRPDLLIPAGDRKLSE